MKKLWRVALVFILFFAFITLPMKAFANGTINAKILGPHGEAAASASYTFTQGATTVSGTTDSTGAISQSLSAGTWTLSVTPPSTIQYAATLTLSTVKVVDGSTFDLGNTYMIFQVPSGADSDLGQFGTTPSVCSQSGTPVILRAYYEDETKQSFLFQGRNANVIVVTDDPTNTVTVDYSILEGHAVGTDVATATSQGGGKFKATHVIANTSQGGGMPIVSVTRGGSTTSTCLTQGPVNLDIRTFFTGNQTTDFTQVSDFRAIPNFTMHQTNVVKVTFSKSVDMLDPTVQRFMKSIAQKMVSSTASINLDAKAVLELKNAGAIITFYNITLNNPKIQVDGADDTTGVTSGLTYDKTAHTLTFNAAHFTTYTAVESSSSSSSSSSSGNNFSPANGPTSVAPPTGCDAMAPLQKPFLYQIDTSRKTATLYFTPVNDYISYYFISYGLSPGSQQFGTTFAFGPSQSAIKYVIRDLAPHTKYYFRVRAGNGCMPGNWSNELAGKTNWRGK